MLLVLLALHLSKKTTEKNEIFVFDKNTEQIYCNRDKS